MKKLALIALCITSLFGCKGEHPINPESLLHHRYQLLSVDNKNRFVGDNDTKPFIEFNENFYINGSMCHQFIGVATFKGNTIKASITPLPKLGEYCTDRPTIELYENLNSLLTGGAKIDLKDNILTLKSKEHVFVYELRDLM
ncbi:hypothetical protein RCS94_04525 [Orbaceae bacterium ac157xtp]